MLQYYYQKVFIWCLIQAISSFFVSYIWLKNPNMAISISVNEFVVVISLYSLYEYYWNLYFYSPNDRSINVI